jgi:hypothetical protein
MPTLCRILKYTPVAMLGALVGAWVCSLLLFASFGVLLDGASTNPCMFYVCSVSGNFTLGYTYNVQPPWLNWKWMPNSGFAGHFEFDPAPRWIQAEIPIVSLITALLPFAVGPLLSFRFSLWHYLVYTALVALELAYYLRWQE